MIFLDGEYACGEWRLAMSSAYSSLEADRL